MPDAGDPTPILHALSRTAFPGRGIVGQLPARLVAPADPVRPIPASPFVSADPAGRDLAILANGERLLACGAFGAAGCIDVDL